MSHIATDTINLGRNDPVQPGETIPDTYRDDAGNEQPVDFERLVELGVAAEGTGYSSLSTNELKDLAAERGLDVEKPTKRNLVKALEADDEANSAE